MATTARVGLEIRLLGPVEAVRDGHVVDLGGARQRALLAVLALHANELVTLDRLVEASFGVDAPGTAANAVQVAVSRLRRRLDPGAIETRAGGYLLAVPAEQIDARRFERLLDKGKELLRRGEPTAAGRRSGGSKLSGSKPPPSGSRPISRRAEAEISCPSSRRSSSSIRCRSGFAGS